MPAITVTTEKVREGQALQVLVLRMLHSDMSVDSACEEVGITRNMFYRWVTRGTNTIDSLRQIISDSQRANLVDITIARRHGVEAMTKLIVSSDVEPKDRLSILKYLDEIGDKLQESHHARPGIEDEAHKFLKKGPTIRQKKSRLAASVEIRQDEEGGLTVDVLREEDVLEAEFSEAETPEDRRSAIPLTSKSELD